MSAIDGVQMAVLSNRFNAVVASMMNTIFRSSRSGVLNSAHDFSCCVISAEHELVMGAESLPIHMMSGPDLISRAIKQTHPDLRRGDAFLHNNPYNGNSHPADHALLVPVIDDDGVHRFSVLAKAHQADCGNSQPTTYMAAATDVYNEGALLFDAVRVQSDYADNDDILRMCRLRIRVPEQWWGDYLALLGAVRIGERRLLELGAELGWETLAAFVGRWLDYSEARMGDAIAALEPGRFSAVTHHDPVPGAPDGIAVTAHVDVDPGARAVRVDLRDNVDCLPNGLNLTTSTARTAAMVGVFNSIGAGVPPNAGSFRRVEVALRRNCAVGEPVHPHSCSAATTNLADRVANAVQRGMAEVSEQVGLAEAGPVIPAASAVVSGNDPRRDGVAFVNQIFLAVTGGAGAPSTDGWLTIFHVGCGGMLRRDSVEIAEMTHPLRVFEQRLLPDTEGAGTFRGAPSAYVEYGPVDTSLVVAYGSDGAEHPALGARGGLAGGPTEHYRLRPESGFQTREPLPAMGFVELADGERIVSITAGGGGYGPPAARPPQRVRADVVEGWITAARARDVYGVALTGDESTVDEAATAELRAGV
ncbi:hydantoinase B/oxoprolinase family protein [Conexibacter sp. CPCC 206217]|uniref:hydantoinase B/oxoprolinase family protein n=1 Tax=Conexibacter sp. CPCC 206217 TaxID=3064574 RepID=UPI00271A3278|nr:hydantoinase B/oxoprolinase family protein [Conexibacter sp. CPCC 206217]MDO8209559.1 hydantoinase B/oxoprolinase family protein [Conexibacter sp. CPCC 206217]